MLSPRKRQFVRMKVIKTRLSNNFLRLIPQNILNRIGSIKHCRQRRQVMHRQKCPIHVSVTQNKTSYISILRTPKSETRRKRTATPTGLADPWERPGAWGGIYNVLGTLSDRFLSFSGF